MTILVTGGSSGIGRAIAVHWAGLGHDVIVNYHANDGAAEETKQVVAAAGGRPVLVKADVGTQDGVRAVTEAVRRETEVLDLYVHCAALAVTGGALEVDPTLLAQAIAVNGTSLVPLVQGLLPVLQRGSSVVYISSRGARSVVPSYVALGPSKSLGEALIRYLAVELAPHGVRANTIAAGPLDTPAFRTMFGDSAQARLDGAAAANPSGRGLGFDDVIAALELITAPQNVMIQGQTLMVDGGISL
ncbi:SDR family oxidoreductase [Nocardioides massiliensis]|uniref:NAD(P)-dependent dehydrogenase (Short-subunit alcohol dehydrogenase family) n=1 Tax=Nocardioides massiliensis TaxID=1325935 RepID=A0ABT9NND8_9ACTN|nr:SDR family oxidoreductase [Nocardioides massiliensis]MDP9821898.1 NAD(P)-dependent dehydrogenase (short-subunit alcohol dehydrogenase family) [Nocardioides massiliensis]